jgi:glycosyltransferase involved in cell wall biosynthesis
MVFVHDWLTIFAGSERVLQQMLMCFPDADLFTLLEVLPEGQRKFIDGKTVRTSFIQHLPFARKAYRYYLPLMPLAVEQFDLSGYDVVISSSHAVAKGVITGPDQLHICMCYSPMRYAWDLQHQYLRDAGLVGGMRGWAARWMLHRIRQWDVRTAAGVDEFIAISRFVARRIWKVYRRTATVIYPPVDVAAFELRTQKEDFYLAASRMVSYKKMDIIVEAFSAMPDKRLIVIGDGPDFGRIRSRAGRNVQMLGYQELDVLRDHLQRARAFIFAAEEDFGIILIEAQACGTPVIAYGKGGSLETIRGVESGVSTGIFFDRQSPTAIVDAVRRFESANISAETCRENAMRFSIERFRAAFTKFVEASRDAWEQRTCARRPGLSVNSGYKG